uniref:Uncharacterized protein n=1 Tax=Anguilla anguilla TaxID=7936 RepID=A0A0E9XFC7_ANGAN
MSLGLRRHSTHTLTLLPNVMQSSRIFTVHLWLDCMCTHLLVYTATKVTVTRNNPQEEIVLQMTPPKSLRRLNMSPYDDRVLSIITLSVTLRKRQDANLD